MDFVNAGFAKIEITPQIINIELCGYGPFLERKFKGVHDPLYARVAVFQAEKELLFLFSCDLVGMDKEITNGVRNNLGQLFSSERIFINICCTHTHSGPATIKVYGWGEPSLLYWEWLRGRLVEVALKAVDNLQKYRIFLGRNEVRNLGVNREEKGGPVDRFVRFAQFKDNSGKSVNFFHHAMHGVVLGEHSKFVSADWPGSAISFIEKKADNIDYAFFFQGACGEINTLPAVCSAEEGFSHIKRIGSEVAKAVIEKGKNLFEINPYTVGAISDVKKLELSVDNESFWVEEIRLLREKAIENGALTNMENLNLHCDQILLDKIKVGREESIEVEISALRLGNLIFVFHPGETSLHFAEQICESFPEFNIWVCSYANDFIGYIPKREYFKNQDSYPAYVVPRIMGRFPLQPDAGDKIVTYSKEMIQKLL